MNNLLNIKNADHILRRTIRRVAEEVNRQSFAGTLDKLPQEYYDYKAANRSLHIAFYATQSEQRSLEVRQ